MRVLRGIFVYMIRERAAYTIIKIIARERLESGAYVNRKLKRVYTIAIEHCRMVPRCKGLMRGSDLLLSISYIISHFKLYSYIIHHCARTNDLYQGLIIVMRIVRRTPNTWYHVYETTREIYERARAKVKWENVYHKSMKWRPRSATSGWSRYLTEYRAKRQLGVSQYASGREHRERSGGHHESFCEHINEPTNCSLTMTSTVTIGEEHALLSNIWLWSEERGSAFYRRYLDYICVTPCDLQ